MPRFEEEYPPLPPFPTQVRAVLYIAVALGVVIATFFVYDFWTGWFALCLWMGGVVTGRMLGPEHP